MMHIESKRVFISDLPEELTNEDVTKRFSKYGSVSSVEIKERKDMGPKNNSKHFAFVNIQIDDGSLQKCFHEISSKEWKGQYVQLQLARENFLDRLKKEREEAKESQSFTIKNAEILPIPKQNNIKDSKILTRSIKQESIDSSTDSSDSEDEKDFNTDVKKIVKNQLANGSSISENQAETFDEISDIVYKSNKSKIVNNKLVIDSVGNNPIFTSTIPKSKSLDPKRTEADQKRLQSMLEKRQGFNRQKLVIKSALAKIDITSNINENFNKPIETVSALQGTSSKMPQLFENEDVDEEEYNFSVKKQYEGTSGQKLLALQSNYKNDKRFTLDERFIDPSEENEEQIENDVVDDLIVEKKREYKIMEGVLGTKITPNIERQKNKLMLRFDPSQPEHSKYEIKHVEATPTKKRKREKVEVVLPEVSQETFFDVGDQLKDALQEKTSFSLLGLFGQPGKTTTEDNKDDNNIEPPKKIRKNNLLHNENPFKYDSSDDENQEEIVEEIPNKKMSKKQNNDSATVSLGVKKLWTESLFFKDDDYRFQDGMEFVMKLGTQDSGGIGEVRQEIKQIVRAKVRNNKGKDKMFKKKLGGQKKFKLRKAQKH